MHAHLSSARLAPKKANLMAKMVRGLSVPSAVELLRKTSKKSARLFEGVLRSAMANAEHTFKQDPQMLVLKTVIVNQGTAYRRGIPMARGRVRPIRKFLSHISITLGFPDTKESGDKKKPKKPMSPKKPTNAKTPQTNTAPVQASAAAAGRSKQSSDSSASSDSSVSSK